MFFPAQAEKEYSIFAINIIEKRIPVSELARYDAAFLSGTSPLILPINRIDELRFDPGLPLLQELMKYYFRLLEEC